jgi:hypothetical protein
MHKVPYVGHPGYQKTIVAVKKQYFWPGMKKEVVDFIVRCLECQKVKVEHRHPTGLLQPFPIPEWKWEVVTMDFITKFPRTAKQHDSIMVVVDKLTKAAHFIPVKSMHKETDIVEIYMQKLLSCMVYLRQLCLTEIPSSPQTFGKGYSKDLEQV